MSVLFLLWHNVLSFAHGFHRYKVIPLFEYNGVLSIILYALFFMQIVGAVLVVYNLLGHRLSIKSIWYFLTPLIILTTVNTWRLTLTNYIVFDEEMALLARSIAANSTVDYDFLIEILILVYIYIVLFVLYNVFLFTSTANLKLSSRVIIAALSQGQEIIISFALLIFLIIKIVNPATSQLEIHLLTYATFMVLFKILEVALLGLYALLFRKKEIAPPYNIRKHIGIFPIVMFVISISAWYFYIRFFMDYYSIMNIFHMIEFVNPVRLISYFGLGSIYYLEVISMATLPLIFFPLLCWFMARRTFYFAFPKLHPIIRNQKQEESEPL
ncbi:MAG: hypothetical protein FWD34_03845 [Oscillospiraceae bacterium]|nr:hypothetical protein [Oscillospiraceae bacterium]